MRGLFGWLPVLFIVNLLLVYCLGILYFVFRCDVGLFTVLDLCLGYLTLFGWVMGWVWVCVVWFAVIDIRSLARLVAVDVWVAHLC